MNNYDDNEKKIHEMLSKIKVDSSNLEKDIKSKIYKEDINRKIKRKKPLTKSTAMAMALVLLLVGGTTAAVLGNFDSFINKFNPDYSSIVEPVELYVEDKGIKMEIIGAQKYDNRAVVYLSLQDITGENRITNETEFRDGFNVKMNSKIKSFAKAKEKSFGFSWGEDMVFFDNDTNTAYYEFNISTDLDYPLTEKLALGSSLIYFDSIRFDQEPIDISLNEIEKAEIINLTEGLIFGGKNIEDETIYNTILKPSNIGELPHKRDDQWISNVDIVDNKLHIQIGKLFNQEFGSNDAMISLKEDKESLIDYDYSLIVLADKNNNLINIENEKLENAKYKYEEFIFPLKSNNMKDYTLLYTGAVSNGQEGDWNLETDIMNSNKNMITLTNINSIDGYNIEYLILSPLGVSMVGNYIEEFKDITDMEVKVESIDEMKKLNLTSGSENKDEMKFNSSWGSNSVLDFNKIKAIIINDVRIEIDSLNKE